MHLKYLELQGFKSFANKTKIVFDKGKTAIVGPNGSGKSNVSDAMHWVLGEQSSKNLRAKTMTHLIFGGTEKLKQQGFAEVSLAFDNVSRSLDYDNDEVKITRRVERNGDSEYKINGELTTLKRIQEMLRDTGLGKEGYAMVRQGRIGAIVQSKSDDRRLMFEEAAGIATFRHRKEEAQKNLKNAEENILRLNDILGVLEKQVGPLKIAAEKAREYLELASESKVIEVSLWVTELNLFNQKMQDESGNKSENVKKAKEIADKLDKITADKEKAYEDSRKCLELQEKLRIDKTNNIEEVSRLKQNNAVSESNINRNEQEIEKLQKEIKSLENNKDQVLLDIESKEEEILKIKDEIEFNKTQVKDFNDKLLEQAKQNEFHSKEQKQLNDEINQLNLDKSGCNIELTRIASDLEEILQNNSNESNENSNYDESLASYNERLQNVTNFFDTLEEKREELRNAYKGHELKLNRNKEKLEALQQENKDTDILIAKISNELNHLKDQEDSMSAFGFSVKEVLTQAKRNQLNGVIGTVSQLVEVDNNYTTAIETALGGSMQNIVVNTEADAKAGINMLARNKKGRATFLPLTSVKGNRLNENGLENYDGYIGIATDLIRFDPKYTGIFNSLLGRIVIVDDLDTATYISKQYGYKFRIVTLDGQVVNAGGSFTGGSKNNGQAFLSKKNEIIDKQNLIREENEKLGKNQQLEKDLDAECNQIQAEFNGIASELTTLKEDARIAELEKESVVELKAQLEQAIENKDKAKKQMEEKKESLLKQNQEYTDLLEKFTEEHQQKTEQLDELLKEYENSSSSKEEINNEIRELGNKEIELSSDIRVLQNQIDSLKDSDNSRLDTIEKYQKEIDDYEETNTNLLQDTDNNQNEIKSKEDENVEIDNQISKANTDKFDFEALNTRLVNEVKDLSVEQESIRSKILSIEEKELNLQEDFDKIIKSLQEQYELTKLEAEEIAVEIEDIEESKAKLNVLKGKIRGLGNVNPNAVEEYKEVSEQYELLSTELADVDKSKKGLLELIDTLTKDMEEMFVTSFDEINKNFREIFVDMFNGGAANLKLTDIDNPLISGIEILVQPPGKKIGDLMQLSGGEQALIAVAIYFAIFKVRPSPFCILDEIDAPLDNVNVDRFAQYLEKFIDRVQFIIITHRHGSMHVANVIYGVVMPSNCGVSSVLTLDVNDVGEQFEMN